MSERAWEVGGCLYLRLLVKHVMLLGIWSWDACAWARWLRETPRNNNREQRLSRTIIKAGWGRATGSAFGKLAKTAWATQTTTTEIEQKEVI